MDPVERTHIAGLEGVYERLGPGDSYIDAMRLDVSDHAMWRAAERFPGFDVALIDTEVRSAIKAGRISSDRRDAGLSAGWASRDDRFCWTEEGGRVYAVRMHHERAVVLTTMRTTRGDDT